MASMATRKATTLPTRSRLIWFEVRWIHLLYKIPKWLTGGPEHGWNGEEERKFSSRFGWQFLGWVRRWWLPSDWHLVPWPIPETCQFWKPLDNWCHPPKFPFCCGGQNTRRQWKTIPPGKQCQCYWLCFRARHLFVFWATSQNTTAGIKAMNNL